MDKTPNNYIYFGPVMIPDLGPNDEWDMAWNLEKVLEKKDTLKSNNKAKNYNIIWKMREMKIEPSLKR